MLECNWMHLKQKITSKIIILIKLPLWITIPTVVIVLAFSICFITFLQEKVVYFSYNNSTCVRQLTILPNFSKPVVINSGYLVKNDEIVKIGSIQLFSLKTCFSANKSPIVGDKKLSIALFGGWFAKKRFILKISEPPVVKLDTLSKSISTIKPLSLKLSVDDLIFQYLLKVDDKFVKCPVKNSVMNCDISSLDLLQGKEYNIKLVRMFGNQNVDTIVEKTVKTISATNIVNASIIPDQVIYDKPKTFIFNFDKSVISSNFILEKIEGEKRTPVITNVLFNDKQLTATIKNDLARDSIYEFSIDKLDSKDGSTLEQPYKLKFSMSDGPSVTGVNVETIGLPLNHTIVINFDQTLNDTQDIAKLVTTSGIQTTISRIKNQIIVDYTNAPICTDLNIQINAGLLSNYGIVQNDTWSFSARTVCRTTAVIGYSKEGRSILAYTFGGGSKTILYTGSIHGNELSTKYLMDAWINELEINARNIPTDKKIVVVPTLNPDGVVAKRRNNSNNVDLNRNFITNDWLTDIFTPANQLLPGGGGLTPMSEPESQVIAAFTIQLKPRLTMSFHGSAGYVIANQAGDSSSLAITYSKLTGYRNMTGNSSAFSYPITGTYDDWMSEKYGLTSVLVELSSNTTSEFSKNKSALWAMARS